MTDQRDGMSSAAGWEAGWPLAQLDPIRRLVAIEAAMPGLVGAERIIEAPFDQVWAWIADLERSVPEFDTTVRHLQVQARRGSEVDLLTRTAHVPFPLKVHAHLESGFCLMRSEPAIYVVGMAAVPQGGQTRFRHTEGVPIRGAGRLLRARVRREVLRDLGGIARHFG